MADLTQDLQVCLSWGSIAESFHSLQSLSVSCFHVILGLPGPCFPSTCMSKAVLTTPLEHFTCPYQLSLLSFRMRSRSSIPSRASSSLDLVVTMSCGLTLQICLKFTLSFHCRRWSFSFVNGQVSLAWSIALHTQELNTRPHVLKERWREERSFQGTPERNSHDKTSSTMMKSSGLSTEPWWTLTFTSNSSLYPSPTQTRLRALAYIPYTSHTIHSSTPRFLSAHQMTFQGTQSNAFSRSTKAM